MYVMTTCHNYVASTYSKLTAGLLTNQHTTTPFPPSSEGVNGKRLLVRKQMYRSGEEVSGVGWKRGGGTATKAE